MPNSWHKAVNDFSPRLAVTTKLTRCSRTSIVFHGIDRYTPALAALARECKGCPETFCKGCHETEHVLCEKWGFSFGQMARVRSREHLQHREGHEFHSCRLSDQQETRLHSLLETL